MKNKAANKKIEELVLDQIVISSYQRPINQRRVEKIAAAFNPAKLGVLVVNHREDGTYAILDGQHRLAAMRAKGITVGTAVVLEGMTLEDEADHFRRQGENVAKLSSIDLFNAGLVAGDEVHRNIDQILTSHGFRAHRTSGPKQIMAIATLERIATQYGYHVLDIVLGYIEASWPTDPTAVRREMLAGFTEFVLRFGRAVTPEQFGERMRDKLPADMFYEHRRRTVGTATSRNAFNPSVRFALCAVIVEAFNKGLAPNSRQRLKLAWDGPKIEYDEVGIWQ